MLCPFCGNESSKVLESRSTAEKASIRRRRECESCQKRFTTYEKIELFPLTIIKKDGLKEEYSRTKLYKSIKIACNKCNIENESIENIIDTLEQEFSFSAKREISSFYLGKRVLEELFHINAVAYLRYLSVFNEFSNIDDFKKEINSYNKQLSSV